MDHPEQAIWIPSSRITAIATWSMLWPGAEGDIGKQVMLPGQKVTAPGEKGLRSSRLAVLWCCGPLSPKVL